MKKMVFLLAAAAVIAAGVSAEPPCNDASCRLDCLNELNECTETCKDEKGGYDDDCRKKCRSRFDDCIKYCEENCE